MNKSEQKLVYSGCWNCGELKLSLVSTQRNQHRHCPNCDFTMDYEYSGWNYGKNFRLAYECKKCGLVLGCDNIGTRDGLNNVYGYGWSIPDVISRSFLNAQRQRLEGIEVVGLR